MLVLEEVVNYTEYAGPPQLRPLLKPFMVPQSQPEAVNTTVFDIIFTYQCANCWSGLLPKLHHYTHHHHCHSALHHYTYDLLQLWTTSNQPVANTIKAEHFMYELCLSFLMLDSQLGSAKLPAFADRLYQ